VTYVGPFGLGNGAFDNNVVDLPIIVLCCLLVSKSVLESPLIMRIVPWVGKLLDCYRGLQICSRGGGRLASGLLCWLVLFGIG
jgi:hypothetical protein